MCVAPFLIGLLECVTCTDINTLSILAKKHIQLGQGLAVFNLQRRIRGKHQVKQRSTCKNNGLLSYVNISCLMSLAHGEQWAMWSVQYTEPGHCHVVIPHMAVDAALHQTADQPPGLETAETACRAFCRFPCEHSKFCGHALGMLQNLVSFTTIYASFSGFHNMFVARLSHAIQPYSTRFCLTSCFVA